MRTFFIFLLSLVSLPIHPQTPNNFYYKNQLHSAYQKGLLESYARSQISTSNGAFDSNRALSFLKKLQEEGGNRKTLREAGNEALSLLIKTSKFTREQIKSLRDWYEQLIKNHPELNVPVDIPVGITILVAGVLMNLIPGGQIVGAGLITIGTGLITKGFADWAERIPLQRN